MRGVDVVLRRFADEFNRARSAWEVNLHAAMDVGSTVDGVQATVVHGAVFEGEPNADARGRFAAQKRIVLMRYHFAADRRLLEDVHRLHRSRIFHPQASQ